MRLYIWGGKEIKKSSTFGSGEAESGKIRRNGYSVLLGGAGIRSGCATRLWREGSKELESFPLFRTGTSQYR